ncbi:MAG: dTDP-4-dehydrorhamnose 3,5-epimerase [Alphaproteobacteria bacterium]|nr:dTDP-4-dehydrorhamnose 3,5-epimerase [Alphaproteobacteria bacterium]MBU2082824.1 dTDP-4-dehydrorhamnose 3,5-epimerase [Alphaproteobacteria bacterium]MBU2142992.1 dTDP-4-dehydrorhamnose 3,5-epimerase [Alphaproteobacteria bacterium]MBU2196586.1 dTDP-4-dehydrorhamnose 3,5-epimerase [Alphaproteobacteria bacterium]
MFYPQHIPEVILVKPQHFGDDRGYFRETYRQSKYDAEGIRGPFVQDNFSMSRDANVLRGLHFQTNPSAQGKLVRCTQGAIFDVAVDIRRGSPNYGQHVSATLSAENGWQMFIPVGFAHGFCTLEPDCAVDYKVTAYYDPSCDKGIAWDDPDIGINWPLSGNSPILSGKDTKQPQFRDLPEFFKYTSPTTKTGMAT